MNSMGQQESPLSAPPDPLGRLDNLCFRGYAISQKIIISHLIIPGGTLGVILDRAIKRPTFFYGHTSILQKDSRKKLLL